MPRTDRSHSPRSSLDPRTLVAALLLTLGSAIAHADEAGAPAEGLPGVEYDAATDRLKVSVENESYRRVMAAVSKLKEGLEIVVHGTAESPISIDFDFVPFEDGLMLLLATKNFAIERGQDGERIENVWVLGEGSGPPPRVAARAPDSSDAARKMMEAAIRDKASMLPMLGVTPEQMDELMVRIDEYEKQTGHSVRDRLKAMRAAIDPDFDPEVDGEEMSDKELVESVVVSAFRAMASGTLIKQPTPPAVPAAPTPP